MVGSENTYAIQIQDNDALYGGFKGDEASFVERGDSWKTYKTIVSGDVGTPGIETDNSNTILFTYNNALVDGIIVEKGKKGISMSQSKGKVQNCILRNNTSCALNMLGSSVDAVVSRCFFVDNTISTSKRTLLIEGTPCLVENCVFYNNHQLSGGGAAAQVKTGKVARFIYCSFVNNNTDSDNGASAIFGSTTTEITACVFYGNRSGSGGEERQVSIANVVSYCAVEDVDDDETALYNVTTSTSNIVDPTINTGFVNISSPAGSDGIYFTSDDGLNLTSSSTSLLNKGSSSVYPFTKTSIDIRSRTRTLNNEDTGAYEL